MKIAIRTDASSLIGTGHVMRCLTLAQGLKKIGHECIFICRNLQGNLSRTIQFQGFTCYLLSPNEEVIRTKNDPYHVDWLECSWELDIKQTSSVLQKIQADWLVVDHYAIDKRWESFALDFITKILVIDDLADRPHHCDILIDQNIGRTNNHYKHLLRDKTKTLIGPQYALLREEFINYREISIENKSSKVNQILISMGGVDINNITGKIIDALIPNELFLAMTIKIVLGASCPWVSQIQEQCMSFGNIQVLINVDNMAELLSQTDVAIGAAGSSTWERCCLGVPTISIVLARNQESIAYFLKKEEISLVIDQSEVEKKEFINILTNLCNNSALRHKLSVNSQKLIDGRGISRVLDAITLQS